MKFFSDFLLLIGVAAVTYGAWRLDPAAGLITGGALFLVAGVARGRAEAAADYEARKRGAK